jgi:hypothetical protein
MSTHPRAKANATIVRGSIRVHAPETDSLQAAWDVTKHSPVMSAIRNISYKPSENQRMEPKQHLFAQDQNNALIAV